MYYYYNVVGNLTNLPQVLAKYSFFAIEHSTKLFNHQYKSCRWSWEPGPTGILQPNPFQIAIARHQKKLSLPIQVLVSSGINQHSISISRSYNNKADSFHLDDSNVRTVANAYILTLSDGRTSELTTELLRVLVQLYGTSGNWYCTVLQYWRTRVHITTLIPPSRTKLYSSTMY